MLNTPIKTKRKKYNRSIEIDLDGLTKEQQTQIRILVSKQKLNAKVWYSKFLFSFIKYKFINGDIEGFEENDGTN